VKIELEGREVTWCIGLAVLGIPVLTAVLVCASMGVFVWLSPEAQERSPGAGAGAERTIQVTVTPEIKAVLPDGAIQVHNTVPPAQIHEVSVSAPDAPDVHVHNAIQPAPVHVTQAPATPKAIAVPVPATPVEREEGAEFGTALPPPKGLKP
jgi:hypothetical protein